MSKTSYEKALELNLDPPIYGTLAEIGAGQETANWFFRVSGTAGLVAKTISAYDMTMSDVIYGAAARYVSQERLEAMLAHEYQLLIERLGEERGSDTTFFAFCNTVRARGYRDTGECHGWLGIRFQFQPGEEPSEIRLHVRLLDDEALEQKEALGILGLNLIYAAFRYRGNLRKFVHSLMDGLSSRRVEVDFLKFDGHRYPHFDNRLCALELVQGRLTDAAMFLPNGDVVQAAEALYGKPVLLLRGSFSPVLNLHMEMMKQAKQAFVETLDEKDRGKEVELCEISIHNLLRSNEMEAVDFIDRADALQALGKTVMISNCAEFHRIAAYLSRATTRKIGLILSIGLLNELFKDKWSVGLEGGLLESFGRLFKRGVSLLVYPWANRHTGELVDAERFEAPEGQGKLYEYLREQRMIMGITCEDRRWLSYTGRDIQKMIEAQDKGWREYVPERVWEIVSRKSL